MTAPRRAALLLTPVLPLPGQSGRQLRAWSWLQSLGERHRVHVVVFGDRPETMPTDYPATVWFYPLRPARQMLWWRRAALMCPPLVLARQGGTDWPVADRPDLAGLMHDDEPERILVFRLYLHHVAGPFLARFPSARRELDLDDLESRTRLSMAGALWRLGRWWLSLRQVILALQYLLAETALLSRYQRLYLAAPEDREELPRSLRIRTKICPNRLSDPSPRRSASADRLLFVGTLDHLPNEEAARFIADRLLPLLPPTDRLGRLTIVGRGASASLRHRLQSARLDHFDSVHDLRPCYAEALCVLVPLWAGGGTKLKTIEAFAHGCAVIATAEGVRGLGAEPGRHYLPAETASGFADAIARLVVDPTLANWLGQNARLLWQQRFCLP